jgi:hypothetical protein
VVKQWLIAKLIKSSSTVRLLRTGKNDGHALVGLLRQSVFGRLFHRRAPGLESYHAPVWLTTMT